MAGAAARLAPPLLARKQQQGPEDFSSCLLLALASCLLCCRAGCCRGACTFTVAYIVCSGSYSNAYGIFLQVHKFGGTCVAAAERIREAAQLIVDESAQCKLVVVSAMGSHPASPVKVTDLLLNMVAKASQQDQAFLIDLAALQARLGARFAVQSATPWSCSS